MASRRARLFGTDGIRGPAGAGPLAPEEVLALGRALAAAAGASPRRTPRVLVARDTRPSGPMIVGALVAGLQAGGASVAYGGVLPTPAAALLVRLRRFDLGVVATASHNPAADNGLKVLGPDGEKAADALERDVEARLPAARRARGVVDGGPAPGEARPGAAEEYAAAVCREFRGLDLRGLPVVVDAGEGACGAIAPAILRRLGATVHAIRCGGDGARINDRCGALHPAPAGRAVRRRGARLGIALDGDGDRLVLLDERGTPRDGDDVLAALAPRWKARGRLPGSAVVGTVMCNGGLEAHLRRHGIDLVRTPVGDRHVAAALRERGLALGAEPSGHILVPRPGGLLAADGLVAALRVAEEMARTRGRLGDLLRGFARIPRAEAAVPVSRRPDLATDPAMAAASRAAEATAGPGGRVLARYSGTEPKLRILVESTSAPAARRACAALAAAAGRILG